jgi:hypothetical protein
MQNKPNRKKAKMNVNEVMIKGYGNSRLAGCAENKPNQTQLFRPLPPKDGIDRRNDRTLHFTKDCGVAAVVVEGFGGGG